MLPGIVIAIPLFIVMSHLGLVDTRLALIIVYLSFNLPIVIWICAASSWRSRGHRAGGGGRRRHDGSDLPADRVADLAVAAVRDRRLRLHRVVDKFFFALILNAAERAHGPPVIPFAGQYQTVFGHMMAAAALDSAVVALAILFRNMINEGSPKAW